MRHFFLNCFSLFIFLICNGSTLSYLQYFLQYLFSFCGGERRKNFFFFFFFSLSVALYFLWTYSIFFFLFFLVFFLLVLTGKEWRFCHFVASVRFSDNERFCIRRTG